MAGNLPIEYNPPTPPPWFPPRQRVGRNPRWKPGRWNKWQTWEAVNYIIALSPTIAGAISALLFHPAWLLLAVLTAGTFLISYNEVPASPPNMAVLTWWGKRIRRRTDDGSLRAVVFPEGIHFILWFWPFLFDLIVILFVKRNEDFDYTKVRCRLDTPDLGGVENRGDTAQSGGSVTVHVGLTWEPDPNRPVQFINAGMDSGVRNILDEVLGEDVRQMGRDRTWEQMTFASDRVAAILISKLTGLLVPELETEKVPYEGQTRTITKRENGKPVETRVLKRAEDATDDEIRHFLDAALMNGAPDIRDLGIIVRRLNVPTVDPEGELVKDAERAARERQQRRAEEYETETVLRIAQMYLEKDETMKWEHACKLARIERGKATQVYIEGGGSLPIVNLGSLGGDQ